MQSSLKYKPQLYMIGFGILSMLSYFVKSVNVSSIFFGILFGFLLFVNLTLLYLLYLDITKEPSLWSGVVAGGFALLLTPIIVLFYFLKIKRHQKSEKMFCLGFLIITVVIFLLFEMNILDR